MAPRPGERVGRRHPRTRTRMTKDMNVTRRSTGAAALLLAAGIAFLPLAGCFRPAGAGDGEACETKPPIEIGQRLGEMMLNDGSGGTASLAEVIDGKIAVVDVWATWCQPCIIALPHLDKLHSQFADRDFTVVGVLVDVNAESVGPEFVEGRDIDYPIFYDDDGDRFMCDWGEFYVIPTMLIVDRDGTVLDVFSGVGDLTAVDRRIEELMGEAVEGVSAVL